MGSLKGVAKIEAMTVSGITQMVVF